MSKETSTARVARLLTMVPWLLAHQGVPMAQAAAQFGLTPAALERDLELLFLCGLPGGMPDWSKCGTALGFISAAAA